LAALNAEGMEGCYSVDLREGFVKMSGSSWNAGVKKTHECYAKDNQENRIWMEDESVNFDSFTVSLNIWFGIVTIVTKVHP
jgi:hypothetical protein